MPVGAFVAVAATVFVAKSFAVWGVVERLPETIEPLVELALDLGIVAPVLIWFLVVPAARNIRQSEASERALRIAREELEVRVHERTAELEESERRLREEAEEKRGAHRAVEFQASLLDAVEQAVTATDGEGRVLYWNRFAEELYGWRAAEVTGRSLRDVITFIEGNAKGLDVLEACAMGASWTGEVEAVRRDGSRFPAYVVCSCLAGEAEGYVCLSLDITVSKVAEEALRDSEEKYSTFVENSPTGIFISQNGQLVFVNPKFAQLLEYSRDELSQREAQLLVHPDDREVAREIVRKRAAGEPVPDECECRLVTKTGQVRWVAIRNTMIRHRGGVAALGTVQDVTERKQMETELRQLSARLLTIQEEERRRVARDLHDSVGQALTGIKFMVEAALGPPWPEERRTGMERLRSLVPTIQGAVEEVRRISTELRPSVLDDLGLLPAIAWYVREFQKNHPRLALEQQFDAMESDVPCALRTPIYRLLQEATTNVAKHSRASRLVIGIEAGGGSLRLRVRDDGVGFDPSVPRGETDARGLGLSSMRERTELSGGTFSLVTAPGAGTTVEATWSIDARVSA